MVGKTNASTQMSQAMGDGIPETFSLTVSCYASYDVCLSYIDEDATSRTINLINWSDVEIVVSKDTPILVTSSWNGTINLGTGSVYYYNEFDPKACSAIISSKLYDVNGSTLTISVGG